jgi:hypothetical protein
MVTPQLICIQAFPESTADAVHLEILELALFSLFFGFLDEKILFSGL